MINPVRISHAVRDALSSPLIHAAQDYGKDQWQGLKNENALIAKIADPVARAIKYNKDTLMNQSLQGHVLQFAVPHVSTAVTYHEAKKHGAKHAGLDALVVGHLTGTAVAAGAWKSYARYRNDASVAEKWTKGNRLAYTFFHGHSIKSAWDDHLSQSGLMDKARRNSTYQKLYNANIGGRSLGSRVRDDILEEASKGSNRPPRPPGGFEGPGYDTNVMYPRASKSNHVQENPRSNKQNWQWTTTSWDKSTRAWKRNKLINLR